MARVVIYDVNTGDVLSYLPRAHTPAYEGRQDALINPAGLDQLLHPNGNIKYGKQFLKVVDGDVVLRSEAEVQALLEARQRAAEEEQLAERLDGSKAVAAKLSQRLALDQADYKSPAFKHAMNIINLILLAEYKAARRYLKAHEQQPGVQEILEAAREVSSELREGE